MRRIALVLLAIGGLTVPIVHAEERPRSRFCGVLEAFDIRAENRFTTCSFAVETAKRVRKVAFSGSGILDRFSIKIRGHRMRCHHFFVERREQIICEGHLRAVRLVYAF